ncbi:MAG: hypothetical protein QM808_11305 [Steroidobacteraceae bacterium]
MSRKTLTLASFLAIFAQTAHSAPVSYSFDSISSFDFLSSADTTITGILKNGTAPVIAAFHHYSNGDTQAYTSRCLPIMLTAMEKPGKYYFNITIDYSQVNTQLVSCGLERRQ